MATRRGLKTRRNCLMHVSDHAEMRDPTQDSPAQHQPRRYNSSHE
jgi:hypothetical protein